MMEEPCVTVLLEMSLDIPCGRHVVVGTGWAINDTVLNQFVSYKIYSGITVKANRKDTHHAQMHNIK